MIILLFLELLYKAQYRRQIRNIYRSIKKNGKGEMLVTLAYYDNIDVERMAYDIMDKLKHRGIKAERMPEMYAAPDNDIMLKVFI